MTIGLSGFPLPPDWLKNAGHGHKEFLEAVPNDLRNSTCRCPMSRGQVFIGWYYNTDRKMWLCATCEKPSPAHQGYNIICIWCERWFTLWEFPITNTELSDLDPDDYKEAIRIAHQLPCRDCGGENDSRIFEDSLF